MEEMNKKELLQKLIKIAESKRQLLEESIEALKQARDSESKSSMGDKYETVRSMLQMEMDQFAGQLDLQKAQLTALNQINADKVYQSVEFGALVRTDKANYLISVASGTHVIAGESIFCISPNSPLSQAMLGCVEGECFSFRNEKVKILSIS